MYKIFMKKSRAEGLTSVGLGILVMLIIIGGVGYSFNASSNNTKLLDMQTNIISLRSQINQAFSSSNGYGELNNELAIKIGAVPQVFIKNTSLVNAWGGDVTLEATDDESGFWITFEDVPQEACNKLGSFQTESWLEIVVNNTTLESSSIVDLSNACSQDSNTLKFSAR